MSEDSFSFFTQTEKLTKFIWIMMKIHPINFSKDKLKKVVKRGCHCANISSKQTHSAGR